MLSLHKITLTNFRSYRKTHEFEFPTNNGLYFLTGLNLENPALGANACGKSTFLDAITWVLFGKTTRGLRSNEILSWGSTGCIVILELTVGSDRLIIKRTQRPISLTLNDKAIDQQELQKHIRLNFDSFMCSVINPQFGTPFLAMPATTKLSLFSDILELDYWLQQSDQANVETKELDGYINEISALIARTEEKIKINQNDISELEGHLNTFEKLKKDKIQIIKDEIELNRGKKYELDAKIQNAKKAKSDIENQLNAVGVEIKKVTPMRNSISEKIKKLEAKNAELNRHAAMLTRQVDNLSEIESECPTCLQIVGSSYLETEHSLRSKELSKVRIDITELGKEINTLNAELKNAQALVDEKTEGLDKLWEESSQFNLVIERATAQFQEVDQQLPSIKKRHDKAKLEVNPHGRMLENKKTKLVTLANTLKEDRMLLADIEVEHKAVSFWIRGFKRVRLFIIEQTFRTLEVEVNNILAQLGMTDWQITFDIERENKSGGLTKGFVVFIKGPNNKEPIKWESWSGGETQRLQLAGDLGLANLIMQRAGLVNTVEFFDEPSTHLSPEGMMDLANMLHERAIEEGKCIWIVDHTSITNFGEFEAVVTARKDIHGSSIAVS